MTLTYTSHSARRSILPQHRESNGSELTPRSGHGVKRLQSRPTQLVLLENVAALIREASRLLILRTYKSAPSRLVSAGLIINPKPFQDKIVASTIHEAM